MEKIEKITEKMVDLIGLMLSLMAPPFVFAVIFWGIKSILALYS